MVHSCTKRLGGLAVTTLPGVSRSFNPALRSTSAFLLLSCDNNV